MIAKWLGASLVVVGCGGVGFSLAHSYKRQIVILSELQDALQIMHGELSCRLTPLPELFGKMAQLQDGSLHKVFAHLSEELEQQNLPDAFECMRAVLARVPDLPDDAAGVLLELGKCMGIFDLDGQLRQLEALQGRCGILLASLNQQKEDRVRQYRTLGICAGAALAILLI